MNKSRFVFSFPVFSLSRIFRLCKSNRYHFRAAQNFPEKAISEQILRDMREAESIWHRTKDDYLFNQHLYKCYAQNDDLLTNSLDMMHYAFKWRSPSLVFSMVKTLDAYIRDKNIAFCPNLIQKTEILISTLKYSDYELLELTCNVFKLKEQSLSFKNFIDDLIKQKSLIEAAYCVTALNLQKEFEIEKILLPLLLEGRFNTSVLYLTNYPDLQQKCAKLLDSYLNISTSTKCTVNLTSNPTPPRKIVKILSSLLNKFEISLEFCPKLHFIRSRGAINTLVNRRKGQSVAENTFEDMITNIIGENEDLKEFLIKKLVINNDLQTALKMAEKFNVDDPSLYISKLNNGNIDNAANLDENKPEFTEIFSEQDNMLEDNFNIHLEFALKAEDIKVISNMEDFVDSINYMSQNYDMIGIDSEWKPHFGLSQDRLALIQLAGHDKVFIFDMLLLSECLEAEHWDMLFDNIFGNSNIIKLGCGIMADVNMILQSIKGTKGKRIKFSHTLDMAIFYQKLQEVYPEKMNTAGDKTSLKGLSSLCDIILGKPLNKEERLCDWEKRPLTASQLEYAALDAHCLLQMYKKLREDSMKESINFDHLSTVAIVLTTSQWKSKKIVREVRNKRAIEYSNAIPVAQLKIVMDSTFESQGKQLQQCGADVVILKNGDTADTAIEISKSEERIIICSEDLWNKVKNKVEEGFYEFFPSIDGKQASASDILKYLIAQKRVKRIFFHCSMCSSHDVFKISAEDCKVLQRLQDTDFTSANTVIKDNLDNFSIEFQVFLNDILNYNLNVKFGSSSNLSTANQCTFICKKCGSIS